jgi:hypothetical protein
VPAVRPLDTHADLFDEDLDDVADRPYAAIQTTADGVLSLRRVQSPDLPKCCGARENRTPDLLDANENSWAFGGSSCNGRTGKPWSERWVCWLPEAARNSAAGSLRAGAGTTGSQQTVCRTSASPPASSWSCSGAVPPRPLVGPEHYREGCDW